MLILKGVAIALSVLCLGLDLALAREKGISPKWSIWAINIGCILIALSF